MRVCKISHRLSDCHPLQFAYEISAQLIFSMVTPLNHFVDYEIRQLYYHKPRSKHSYHGEITANICYHHVQTLCCSKNPKMDHFQAQRSHRSQCNSRSFVKTSLRLPRECARCDSKCKQDTTNNPSHATKGAKESHLAVQNRHVRKTECVVRSTKSVRTIILNAPPITT